MLTFFLLSFIVTPPFCIILLYTHISEYQPDGRTKEEVKADVRKKLLQHPLAWLWLIVSVLIILALNGALHLPKI